MFSKVIFASIAIGALSVNAFATPVARSPGPEPQRESPQSFSTTPYHDLTFVSFDRNWPGTLKLRNLKLQTGTKTFPLASSRIRIKP